MKHNSIYGINKKIISCKKCPRLVRYISSISKTKVRRFSNQKYWAKPLPGFGDVNAQVFIIGLAPAAHGGNRTGRMFTGDSSGDWLAKVLYDFDFANKPTSENIRDGLLLNNAYVTATIRCAPPQNKPTREELDNCSIYLKEELRLLKNIKVIICLGKIAFDACSKLVGIKGYKFSHGAIITHDNFTIISSYHPSRQNTQTGKLSWKQWSEIFSTAKSILE